MQQLCLISNGILSENSAMTILSYFILMMITSPFLIKSLTDCHPTPVMTFSPSFHLCLLNDGHGAFRFLLLLCSFLAEGHRGSTWGSRRGKEVPFKAGCKGIWGIPKSQNLGNFFAFLELSLWTWRHLQIYRNGRENDALYFRVSYELGEINQT